MFCKIWELCYLWLEMLFQIGRFLLAERVWRALWQRLTTPLPLAPIGSRYVCFFQELFWLLRSNLNSWNDFHLFWEKVPNGMRASLKKETMPPTFFPSLNFTRIYFDLLCVSTAWWRRETHYTFASVKGFVPRTSSSFYESNWRIGILNSIIDYNHLPSEGKRRQLVWVAPIQQDLIHFKCIVTVKEEAHNKNKKLDMKRGSIFHNVNPFIWIYSKKWNIKSHHQKPLVHGYLQTYCYRRANTRDAHSFHVTGLRVIYIIWDCRVIAFVCFCDGTLSTKTPGNTCHLARPVPHSSPLLSYAFHLLSSGEEMDSLPIRELRPRGTCQIALDCSSD